MIMMIIGGMLIGASIKKWVDNIACVKTQGRHHSIYYRSVHDQESRT